MRIRPVIAMAFAAALAASHAQATTVSGVLTVDNGFFAYISTDNSVLGTLVASGQAWGATEPVANSQIPFSFTSFTLTPGQTYYLHLEAINHGADGGFLGQFTLSDANFYFGNGTQFLKTGTNPQGGSGTYNNSVSNGTPQPWVTPTGTVVSYGYNGFGPWNVTVSDITSSAQWIWPSDATEISGGACQFCTVDFSAPIFASATPLPAALPLFASGLGAMGLLGWRRKRKGAAAIAAA